MRASRLLSILMILQSRDLVTAKDLSTECEVSLRTIYRDIDALSAAGVPVYADRGSAGGYRLLGGYRTRLNGLSPEEAEAVFLSGLPGPAEALGFGSSLATAQLKILTALPPDMKRAADRVRARFHFDASNWFHDADPPPHLHELAFAVWNDRKIDIRYRSWKAERTRRLAPLGLVLKGGAWYLVGSVDGSARTYHVGRIRELKVSDEGFLRRDDFDLSAHWTGSTKRLEVELHPNIAVVRLSAIGVKLMPAFLSPYMRSQAVMGDGDESGRRLATMPVGSGWSAASEFLRFGPELEVLEPPGLRQHMREAIEKMHRQYRLDAASVPPSDGVE